MCDPLRSAISGSSWLEVEVVADEAAASGTKAAPGADAASGAARQLAVSSIDLNKFMAVDEMRSSTALQSVHARKGNTKKVKVRHLLAISGIWEAFRCQKF